MRRCLAVLAALPCLFAIAHADDWPQWLGPKRDGVWRETGIVAKFPEGGLKLRWRTPLNGGYAGPAIANGKVYVTDWKRDGAAVKKPPMKLGSTPGTERIVCLNEADGKLLWEHKYQTSYRISYPAGPRCTPVVANGKVYCLGAMGNLICLDADKGTVLWQKDFQKEYRAEIPLWGWSAHPLLDGDKLICLVGGKDSVVVAFHRDTGKELWRALSASEIGYCPPMIYEIGGKRLLVVWHPDAVNGLDPETGKVHWSQSFNLKAGLSIPTPRVVGDKLFITAFYNGPMMLKLDPAKQTAQVLWRGNSDSEKQTDKLHAIMCTPVIKNGYIYGVCSYGQLRCLKLDTGERVWETYKATTNDGRAARWANAFLIEHEDRFFLFNELGELIIARLSPDKQYEEISRQKLLEPTNVAMGRDIVWSHPAFANKNVYARNDKEIVCYSLAK
jgi:outer membrane protein assembly factor BamB